MPVPTCTKCGRITNSMTSNYWARTEPDCKTPKEVGVASVCYAAFVDGKWVKGCSYESITPEKRKMIDKLFAE